MQLHPLIDNDPSLYGDCDGAECTIRLKESMGPQLMQHTFYHELVHAICFTLGWGKMNEDEDKVDALASLLFQFLQSKKGRPTTP